MVEIIMWHNIVMQDKDRGSN